jgi:pectate lyase
MDPTAPARSGWVASAVLSLLLAACGGAEEAARPATEQPDAVAAQGEAPAAGTTEQEAWTDDGKDEAGAKPVPVSSRVTGFAAKVSLKVPKARTSNTGAGSSEEETVIGVTGGAGATQDNVVTVRTPSDLEKALCNKANGLYCLDKERRIIQVEGVIDMSGPEAETDGCYANASSCSLPQKPEATILVATDPKYRAELQAAHCANKTMQKFSYRPAGVTGLLVGSNKTIIGIGANARLKGRGLLLTGGVSNIVIRNLAFTDINSGRVFGGDAIKLFDAKGVWVDHNYFARIGRQMISTSTANGAKAALSSDITISNNEFDGRNEYSPDCSGKSYWGLLLAGSDRVTLVGNWLHDIGGRWPKLSADKHASVIHMVNNFFENSTSNGAALQYSGEGMRVFAEGNYFSKVTRPVDRIDHHGAQLFGLYTQTTALRNTCIGAIRRICSGNIADPKDGNGTMVQDTAAITAMKPFAAAGSLVKAYSAADVPETVRANAGVGKLVN